MRGFNYLLFSVLAATGAIANDAVPASAFTGANIFKEVIKKSAPLWTFSASEHCLPTAAVLDNGSQNPGGSRQCVTKHPTGGTKGDIWEIKTKFPTYYFAQKCEYGGGDVQYRILYNLYIPDDSYSLHIHDWEYAIVVWKRRSDGMFIRDAIFLEQHGKNSYLKWGDIPHTVNSWSDRNTRFARNRNHPKLFVAPTGHPIFEHVPEPEGNTCLNPKNDLCQGKTIARAGAWAAGFLKNGITNIPEDWSWGKANSKPSAFKPGSYKDICWKI